SRHVTFCRFARSQSDTTIAHDHRRHTMPRRTGNERVPADLGIVVSMRIDKTWCNNEVRGIYRAMSTIRDLANRDNLPPPGLPHQHDVPEPLYHRSLSRS